MPTAEADEILVWLESAAGTIEAISRVVPADSITTPGPDPATFSLVEHVWHLADLEAEGYAVRITRLLAEDEPFLQDFDGAKTAAERHYRSRALDAGLRAFASARAANTVQLRHLSPEAWARSGTQEAVGSVTVLDVARAMVQHDAAHLEELRALLQHVGVPWPLTPRP